jgi:hypothetical protein
VELLLDFGVKINPRTSCFEELTYRKLWRVARAMLDAGLPANIQHFDIGKDSIKCVHMDQSRTLKGTESCDYQIGFIYTFINLMVLIPGNLF